MTKERVRMIIGGSLVGLALAGCHAAAGKENKHSRNLPSPVAVTLEKAFPKAEIRQVEREKETITVYQVKFVQARLDYEVKIAADGTIMEIEREVAPGNLPQAVAKALAGVAKDAQIKTIERAETHAVVGIVRLQKPRVVYEAEFIQDGKEVEVKIREDGIFLGKESKDGMFLDKEIEDKSDNDDDDEEENERAISLDQVPAAAKATILREAGSNRIKEIEEEIRGGKRIYEAEWVVNGREVEVKVTSDGKQRGYG